MKTAFGHWENRLADIQAAGLLKKERVITTPQGAQIATREKTEMINMCANNYLGLADHTGVRAAAADALGRWGYGCASVRFICGTMDVHLHLEEKLSGFLGTEDTILYSSCFDANGGLFEVLLSAEDAIISDELNHASIIDGVRLCKAARYRYLNNDMSDLETQLQAAGAAGARIKAIVTDGVFSMDGTVANLPVICDLAEKYDAIVIVDDSHGTGVIGAGLRGTHEFHGCMGRVDILTGTLGKALGGGSGGYTSGKRTVIDLLRQASRTYLFSNSLSPVIAATSCYILDLLSSPKEGGRLREKLYKNTALFREGLAELGYDTGRAPAFAPGHPIVPVMCGDEAEARRLADGLYARNIYAVGFWFPVVPKGKARVRCQVSAAHTQGQLERALQAFAELK